VGFALSSRLRNLILKSQFSVKILILASKLYDPQFWAVCGRGTLLNQNCAANEAQESACHPNSLALIVFEISAFIRTDR